MSITMMHSTVLKLGCKARCANYDKEGFTACEANCGTILARVAMGDNMVELAGEDSGLRYARSSKFQHGDSAELSGAVWYHDALCGPPLSTREAPGE